MILLSTEQQLRMMDWRHLHTHLAWIYEGSPQNATGQAKREYMTAWHLLEGSVSLIMDEGETTAEKGDWLLLPPGKDERRFSPQAKILSLHFDARWDTGQPLFQLPERTIITDEQATSWRVPLLPLLEIVKHQFPHAYHFLPREKADFSSYTQLQFHFNQWITAVWSTLQDNGIHINLLPPENDHASEIQKHLDRQALNEPFRLHALARNVHLSPSHTNRIFCETYGITPRKYFEQRRLEHAKFELQRTSLSVKEIAYTLGFRHAPQFTNWFRRLTGFSPIEFRTTQAKQ